nr:MAG TPA: Alginate and motility regulator [Ackermannviridae sp.]
MEDLKTRKIKTEKEGTYNVSLRVDKRINDGLKKLGFMYDLRKAEVMRQILTMYVEEKVYGNKGEYVNDR